MSVVAEPGPEGPEVLALYGRVAERYGLSEEEVRRLFDARVATLATRLSAEHLPRAPLLRIARYARASVLCNARSLLDQVPGDGNVMDLFGLGPTWDEAVRTNAARFEAMGELGKLSYMRNARELGYRCKTRTCHGKDPLIMFEHKQLRAIDEGMTLVLTCLRCGGTKTVVQDHVPSAAPSPAAVPLGPASRDVPRPHLAGAAAALGDPSVLALEEVPAGKEIRKRVEAGDVEIHAVVGELQVRWVPGRERVTVPEGGSLAVPAGREYAIPRAAHARRVLWRGGAPPPYPRRPSAA